MNEMQAGFYKNSSDRVEAALVRSWFAEPVAVEHYSRASASLGLWRSETVVIDRVFRRDARLLDVGCGAGRIALGMARMGFGAVLGVDNCAPMVAEARRLAAAMAVPVDFWDGDALDLPFSKGAFDGAIFGFNGLMQIPARRNRHVALRELARVVVPGGHLVFTTHDRELPGQIAYWKDESERWRTGQRDPALVDFGDRLIDNPEGRIFMHVPDRAEVLEDLAVAGWLPVEDHPRSILANETRAVREFSDECRFWVARRPD